MQKQFLEFIQFKKLFQPHDKILLTVSGGIDSMVMLHLFVKSKMKVAVAHCNFSLRGRESNAEEKFVQKYCQKLGIDFYSKKFDTLSYASIQGISRQMAARELRYSWFEKLRSEINFDYIATAHHQTDLAETLLINLLRGTGISGLHGIAAKKKKIIRPLLFATRTTIETYAKSNKLAFKEDSSNANDDYLRNRIRHHVLPQLKKINPDFEQAFYETAGRVADAESVFHASIKSKKSELEQKDKTEVSYSIAKLKKLKPLSIYLFEFLKTYDFSATVCSEIERALNNNSGVQFYSETHRLLIDRYWIRISKRSESKHNKKYSIPSTQVELKQPIQLSIMEFNTSNEFKISKEKKIAQVDAAKVTFPLELRRWENGDSFHPLGMKGRKKLSDFFIDNKLSIFDKEKIWLLCSGKKIIWVINHRIDDRFKITPNTKKIIQIEYFES